MGKFDAASFLGLAEKHRATHAMLVPVQYRRLMELADFDRYDLSSFKMKSCTSAPFPASLKAEVLKRWPGGLAEVWGMTEGGGSTLLFAHEWPDKLHTVGRPSPGNDLRLIDDQGKEVAQGELGEIVGHSPAMMSGYHDRPERTAEVEWHDAEGKCFIRTGDIGRFDEDGFLILVDRKKDMIISGGFNIYPGDLEAVLAAHEAIAEAAVIGVASERWARLRWLTWCSSRRPRPPPRRFVNSPTRGSAGRSGSPRSRSSIGSRATPSARCSSANCASGIPR